MTLLKINPKKERGAVCSWCGAMVKAPARFNALVYCPMKKMGASGVPGGLPRFTYRDGHQLVVAPAELRTTAGRSSFFARVAAAAVAAAASWRATWKATR